MGEPFEKMENVEEMETEDQVTSATTSEQLPKNDEQLETDDNNSTNFIRVTYDNNPSKPKEVSDDETRSTNNLIDQSPDDLITSDLAGGSHSETKSWEEDNN